MADGGGIRRDRGPLKGGVGASVPHDSAAKHVAGEAVYIDDIPELPGTLSALLGVRVHRLVLDGAERLVLGGPS